jgi:protein-tyrosine phosphatase
VPNCKSFLVTEAERKHVRRRARSGPVGLPPAPWTEKKQLKGRHFFFDAEVNAVAKTWLDGQTF